MISPTSIFVIILTITNLASSALITVLGQANYDLPDPFQFVPAEITAQVGDVLEFHFGAPGLGVLGSNHSVAQGVFGQPCNPASNGFFSGYMAVNGTSKQAVS
jgi:hypothetical protein